MLFRSRGTARGRASGRIDVLALGLGAAIIFRLPVSDAARLRRRRVVDHDAHEDVVRILLEEGAPERTVFHCFSGDAELARICNQHGWYMSFSGTVTFKNSHDLQEALSVARPELVMVETDAPFLTPHPYRGRPNAPYLVVQTARWIAEHLQTPLEEFCARVDTTVREVYGQH